MIPVNYTFPVETKSVNGSSACCSNVSANNCEPTSNVLFDGMIPTLSGLDGNKWASQLLTINSNHAEMTFDFTGIPHFTGVKRVEIVFFNYEQWGISVSNVSLLNNMSINIGRNINATFTPHNTLVKVCTSVTKENQTGIFILRFDTLHSWMHIAEVIFYISESISTCPSRAVINGAYTPSTVCASMSSSQIPTFSTTPEKTQNMLPIVLSVVFLFAFIILVCVVAALLLLWRCYSAKHHKHNTSPHSTLGEGAQPGPHPHSHPPPHSLCEETGQALYFTEQDEAGEENHYSTLQHGTNRLRGGAQLHERSSNAPREEEQDMGEYSTLSQPSATPSQFHAEADKKKGLAATGHPISEADTAMDQLYAQVDKKKRKKVSLANASDADTAMDQLYAQVDKKKSKKKDVAVTSAGTKPRASEVDKAFEQHTEVDKKHRELTTNLHASEADTAVDQLYAQVDKKKSKKSKVVSEESTEESGAVYSVVNKPKAPQLPPKSDLLMEELNDA